MNIEKVELRIVLSAHITRRSERNVVHVEKQDTGPATTTWMSL